VPDGGRPAVWRALDQRVQGTRATRVEELQAGQVEKHRTWHLPHRLGRALGERVGCYQVEFAGYPQHARAVAADGPDLHSIGRHFPLPPFHRQ
jgi:hypothetical protein